MAVRARRNTGTSWRRALALSLGLHALLLLAIGIGASAPFAGPGDASGSVGTIPSVADVPTMVDLAAIEMESIPSVTMAPPLRPPADLSTAPSADQARAISRAAVPSAPGTADRRSPAPDRGVDRGRAVEDPVWRRDATTLHERLTDGAQTYQPSHARTAAHDTAPQAVRREPVTGLGDSSQTNRAQHTASPASYGVLDPDGQGLGATTVEGAAMVPPVADPSVPEAQRTVLASSQGPLTAERGTRSFDVELPGLAASDNRVQRAASHEDHPGITDLTLAAVSGNGSSGRGVSDKPGAVTRASIGVSPSLAGARGATGTTSDDPWTQERRYDRYKQEIGDRVNKALVFPRTLAVRLEQGETILRFIVRPDGKLGDSIQVIKSSGFAEFDQAALDAVRKALPFRPMSDHGRAQPLGVTLPVTFSNPVIR